MCMGSSKGVWECESDRQCAVSYPVRQNACRQSLCSGHIIDLWGKLRSIAGAYPRSQNILAIHIPSLLDSLIRFDTFYQSTRPQGRMGETEAQGMKAERDFRSERADALFAKAAESLCSTRLALAQILSYLVMVFLQSFACTCLYSCTGLD